MRPRYWIPVLLACLPACFLWQQKPEPNLLLIVVDCLRADAISQSLGSARTPNLRSLAADGISFPWCFAHTPDALTSHAALLSARAPVETGAVGMDGLPGDLELVAEWLAQKKYRTVAAVSLPELTSLSGAGFERGFQSFERRCDAGGEHGGAQQDEHSVPHGAASARDVNAAVLPHLVRLEGGAPWFALVQYSEPAAPYDSYGTEQALATATLDGRLLDTFAIGDGTVWTRELELAPGRHELVLASDEEFAASGGRCSALIDPPPAADGLHAPIGPVRQMRFVLANGEDRVVRSPFSVRIHDAPGPAQARQRYKLEVESVDRAIGELLDELRRTNQYDDTVIVLTADHGASLGEHAAVAESANLYDELLRVPLIVKPVKDDRRAAALGRSKYTLVRHADVVPTALDLIDVRPLPGARGVSLLDGAERTLLAEAHPPSATSTVCAMRDERYKLIYYAADDRFELYDLHGDTLEVDNVFEVQGSLRASWQTALRKLAASSPESIRARVGYRVEDARKPERRP